MSIQKHKIWFKGRIIPRADAVVQALSPAAQFGLNVFEGVRCYWNEGEGQLYGFRLREHLLRLERSCKLLSLDMPYKISEIESFIRAVIIENDYHEDIALRITVFVDGDDTWSSKRAPDLFIAPISRARKSQLTGQTAMFSHWRRIDDLSMSPRVKCGANYINSRYAFLDAQRKGFDVPIFLNSENKVSEGPGACLMVVREGKLITPDLPSGILESITRETLIKLADQLGIPTSERRIDPSELYLADEVFLCGSAAEVTPILSVDGVNIGDGQVGILTSKLAKDYLRIVDGTSKIFKDWLFPVYRTEDEF